MQSVYRPVIGVSNIWRLSRCGQRSSDDHRAYTLEGISSILLGLCHILSVSVTSMLTIGRPLQKGMHILAAFDQTRRCALKVTLWVVLSSFLKYGACAALDLSSRHIFK